jgi:hypothetical protein
MKHKDYLERVAKALEEPIEYDESIMLSNRFAIGPFSLDWSYVQFAAQYAAQYAYVPYVPLQITPPILYQKKAIK